ncbi:MAG: hypothetical protein WA937_11620 [Flavobacteriales bacterium]
MAEGSLRIGIACTGTQLPQWQLKCVQELLAVPGVAVVAVLELPEPETQEATAALYRWWLRRSSRAGLLMEQDASALLADFPRVAQAGTNLPEVLREYPMDALLQLNGAELSNAEEGAIPFGIWQFMHGGLGSGSNPIPGLWEFLKDEPMTSALLQSHSTASGKNGVLREGFFRTLDHSVVKTAESVLAECAIWPALACRSILSGDSQIITDTPGPSDGLRATPGNSDMLALLWKEFANGRQQRNHSTASDEWNIGVLPHPVQDLLDESPNLNVRWLPPPAPGQSRSTPFGWMKEENLNVLYEKYQPDTGEGVIARLRPKKDNNLKRSRTVLEASGHLTYPFILEHDGQIYVIPEQTHTGKVDLFLLDDEGTTLTFVRTLLEQPLCSPTLFQHEERWWLFGTDTRMPDTLLLAFHSKRFDGPYAPHQLNPIKTDIRSARPGGTPFHHAGALWRPAQDGSVSGGQIIFNRIVSLTPTQFHEQAAKRMEPVPGPWSHGLHTVSAMGDVTLVDGMRKHSGKARSKSQREQGRKKNAHAS